MVYNQTPLVSNDKNSNIANSHKTESDKISIQYANCFLSLGGKSYYRTFWNRKESCAN